MTKRLIIFLLAGGLVPVLAQKGQGKMGGAGLGATPPPVATQSVKAAPRASSPAIAPSRRDDRVRIGGISQPGAVHCRVARVAKPEHSVFPVAGQADGKQPRIAGAGDS